MVRDVRVARAAVAIAATRVWCVVSTAGRYPELYRRELRGGKREGY